VLLCLAVAALAGCQRLGGSFAPKPGDLLFQDLDGGPLCDAIEAVTEGVRGAKFSHVGIAARANDGQGIVIEAGGGGVKTTPLEQFLARSRDAKGRPKVLVGRLRPELAHLIPRALEEAAALLGKPYDKVFAVGNDSYYCSELVYEAFRRANGGRPAFELAPMTFKDPATGATMPTWVEYYRKLNAPIPEGQPGINPGGISRSPLLRIVHAYGRPTGW